jgi:hypothetical protein
LIEISADFLCSNVEWYQYDGEVVTCRNALTPMSRRTTNKSFSDASTGNSRRKVLLRKNDESIISTRHPPLSASNRRNIFEPTTPNPFLAESSPSKSSKGSTSPWTLSKVNISKFRQLEKPGSSPSRHRAVSQKPGDDTHESLTTRNEMATLSVYKSWLPVMSTEKDDTFSLNGRKVSEQIESLYLATSLEFQRKSAKEATQQHDPLSRSLTRVFGKRETAPVQARAMHQRQRQVSMVASMKELFKKGFDTKPPTNKEPVPLPKSQALDLTDCAKENNAIPEPFDAPESSPSPPPFQNLVASPQRGHRQALCRRKRSLRQKPERQVISQTWIQFASRFGPCRQLSTPRKRFTERS